jgi:hypothetical protein
MKPLLTIAVVSALAGVARADHVPQLLDQAEMGFEIAAEWKAPRTWAPRARLPVYMKNGGYRDVLVVQHQRGGAAWGPSQRCDAAEVHGDVVVFSCPALDELNTQVLGAHAMALTYRRHDKQEQRDFVTVFYTVARFQREQ